MRRSAEDALLPLGGDQLPEDPRPSKAIPQPTKTRTITAELTFQWSVPGSTLPVAKMPVAPSLVVA